MESTAYARSRARLHWTLGILPLAPTISGLQQMLLGAQGVPGHVGGDRAAIEGELRYANHPPHVAQ